jgi:peptidoglycan LD-endopeptidase CwlK
MAISLETLLDRSINRMGQEINPIVKESAIEVIKRAYAEGIYVQLSSGYRSITEQNRLYAQGRTALGNIVTYAKGGESYHNYGLAVDYYLLSEDGKTAQWNVNDKWRRVAQIAKELGFEWGGDWTGFVDYPHLQMTGGLTTAQIQAGMKPNLVSKIRDKSLTAAGTQEKTDVSPKIQPSNQTIRNAISTVLLRFQSKDIPISSEWRDQANRGELSISDAIGLLYVAIDRGYIEGKQK